MLNLIRPDDGDDSNNCYCVGFQTYNNTVIINTTSHPTDDGGAYAKITSQARLIIFNIILLLWVPLIVKLI